MRGGRKDDCVRRRDLCQLLLVRERKDRGEDVAASVGAAHPPDCEPSEEGELAAWLPLLLRRGDATAARATDGCALPGEAHPCLPEELRPQHLAQEGCTPNYTWLRDARARGKSNKMLTAMLLLHRRSSRALLCPELSISFSLGRVLSPGMFRTSDFLCFFFSKYYSSLCSARVYRLLGFDAEGFVFPFGISCLPL